jgi:hypothetical protein
MPLMLPDHRVPGGLVGPISPWWGTLPLAAIALTLWLIFIGRIPSHFGFGWPGDTRGASFAFYAVLFTYFLIVVQGITLRVVDPTLSLIGLGGICDSATDAIRPYVCHLYGGLLNTFMYGITAVVMVGVARYQVSLVPACGVAHETAECACRCRFS